MPVGCGVCAAVRYVEQEFEAYDGGANQPEAFPAGFVAGGDSARDCDAACAYVFYQQAFPFQRVPGGGGEDVCVLVGADGVRVADWHVDDYRAVYVRLAGGDCAVVDCEFDAVVLRDLLSGIGAAGVGAGFQPGDSGDAVSGVLPLGVRRGWGPAGGAEGVRAVRCLFVCDLLADAPRRTAGEKEGAVFEDVGVAFFASDQSFLVANQCVSFY